MNKLRREDIIAHQVQSPLRPLPGIKNIIAVGSGKGGVGKSTVSLNLALALSQQGAHVGLLDADIYGPSQPLMLGENATPKLENKKLLPVTRYGIQTMSIGYLVDEQSAMIWRGPMVSSALKQMLHDTLWQDLDFLIIDLPPGTGDIQLTMAQKIPIAGAVVVTTPQDLSLLDARRAVAMFNKVHINTLGIIENMSHYHCPKCGHVEAIFGEGGGQHMADQFDLALLGQLPLHRRLREDVDAGIPTLVNAPESALAQLFHQCATKLVEELNKRPKSYSAKFPHIVVEK